MVKRFLKEILLRAGLYYKVNSYRFRHDQRNALQRAFYAGLIGKADLVFDVGANVGQRSELFSQLAAKVIAFEPQAECVRHLKSRFRFKQNVVIEHLALSETAGEAVIYESSAHTVSSMSPQYIETVGKEVFADQTWSREVAIPTATLDQMIVRYGRPRFIKIDVEGFELNVLKGLSQTIPFISFEFTPIVINEAKNCVDRLHEISGDFLFDYCFGEDLNFVLPEHVDYRTFSRDVLPKLGRAGSFGDFYAIMKSEDLRSA